MKVWTLMENTAADAGFACEHGLSLYIEANGRRILFDTGQTGAFADNAAKMGVELSGVDACILSHGHYDHGGGIRRFLAENSRAPVYVSRHAFDRYYNAEEKYIGLDSALQSQSRIVRVQEEHSLFEGMTLFSCESRPRPYITPPYGMHALRGAQTEEDDFRHEQYLLIREGEKRVLISGCSHKGVLNIAAWFAPDVLIGGFHLMKVDPLAQAALLHGTAERLLAGRTVYYTGHCTGEAQYDALKACMGARLHRLRAGTAFEI